MSEKKLFFYVKILAAAGILLAIYLLWEQSTQSAFQPCNINATVNCNAIISGEVAKTFGLPTPLYGLIGYVVILISGFLKKKKLLLTMTIFGLTFCLWIAYKELFQLHVVCPACILCQLIMITTFTFALMVNKRVE